MKILDITASEEPVPSHLPTMIRGLRPALSWWLAAVLLPTISGYPGVIMLTPAAWILAGWVGFAYAVEARTLGLRPRLRLAALLGMIFALVLALVFWLVGRFVIPIAPHEVGEVVHLGLMAGGVGVAICVPLSVTGAWLVRKQTTF